jgi:hypothetical protein
MPNHHRSRFSILPLSILPLVLVLGAAAGCSSADSSTDNVGATSADALTGDEQAEGAAWDGVDEDDLSPEEQAELSATVDPDGDNGASDNGDPSSGGNVQTASIVPISPELHPLSDCTHMSGFNHGKAMSICATTIDGKAVEQSTADAYEKMHAAAKEAGVTIIVVSGFRTMEKQRELYALYKSGHGNLAAPPGFSNHQSGHALDLNTKAPGVKSWLIAHAASFGFKRTVPSEDWHYEKW